jgi:redox-sensitive bicupin YhaK (pirin superfamily)
MAEITMDPHASLNQDIPTSYNGFVFPIRDTFTIGEDAALVKTGQVG